MLVASAAAAVLAISAKPAAADSTCPEANPVYTDACGPTLVVPTWTDAGGWTDPSQYETIHLADLEGIGRDQLFARTPAGIEVWYFDTTLGQWRPEVDANDTPTLLTAFASPAPLSDTHPNPPKTDWTLPQYYQTIQAANIDGGNGEEILARSADGLIVFKFTPGSSPGVGTWKQLTTSGPFPDADGWDKPQYYRTIQAGDIDGDGKAEVIGRGRDGLDAFRWTGSGWQQLPSLSSLSDQGGYDQPEYYSSIQLGNLDGNPEHAERLVARNGNGVTAWKFTGTGWSVMNNFSFPFSDHSPSADCPFVSGGTACFGSGPEYYSTIKLADVDGSGRDELVGRASDGLRVYRYQGNVPNGWAKLPTLSALSDAGGWNQPKYYSTLQFADLLGNGQQQAIARDKNGIVMWNYDASTRTWTQLSANPALALADDPWGSDASYYGSIRTGDITGTGRAAVVGRGPYGMRTWFYNSGAWSSYLPQGSSSYPQFTGGQKAAFDELTTLAKQYNVIRPGQASVRDVWTSQSPPQDSDLTALQTGLLSFAQCSKPNPGNPPSYGTCTAPSNSGVANTDWTAVINEVLFEIYSAHQVVAFFTQLNSLRGNIFLVQNAELPAIGSDLHLDAAADAETTIDPKEFYSAIFGAAGAVAAEVPGIGPPLGVFLEVTSELMSALPSASRTLESKFPAKYAELQSKFATAAGEAIQTLDANSQEVRQNFQLLTLVSELRERGTWSLDPHGLLSSATQGFALWVYKQLLPTLYVRYKITKCGGSPVIQCTASGSPVGRVGDPPNFEVLGPPRQQDPLLGPVKPCRHATWGDSCDYPNVPDDIATVVWGKVVGTCNYQPGNSNTGWNFGCGLGVDPVKSVGLAQGPEHGWDFTSYCGDPEVFSESDLCPAGSATVGSRAHVTLSTNVTLPPGFQVKSASLLAGRVLEELPFFDRLVDRESGRPLGALALEPHRNPGTLQSAPARSGPLAQLRVRRSAFGGISLTLRLNAVRVDIPDTCQELSGPDAPPFALATTIRLYDGARTDPVHVSGLWRCVWNRVGAVTSLRTLSAKPLPHRPGLAVSIAGPRTVRAGAIVTYVVRVDDRRPARRNRIISSLWHVVVEAVSAPSGARLRTQVRSRTWRITELRRGRSRSFRLEVHAPAAGHFCTDVYAQADSARSAASRLCAEASP